MTNVWLQNVLLPKFLWTGILLDFNYIKNTINCTSKFLGQYNI